MADSVDAHPTLNATTTAIEERAMIEVAGELTDVLSSSNQDTNDLPFKCKRCGFSVQYKSGLVRHLTNARPCPARLQDVDVEVLRTEIDDMKQDRVKMSCICKKCGKKFASRQSRYQHETFNRCKEVVEEFRPIVRPDVTQAVTALLDGLDTARTQPIVIEPTPIFEPRNAPTQCIDDDTAQEVDIAVTVADTRDETCAATVSDEDKPTEHCFVTDVKDMDDCIMIGDTRLRKTNEKPPRVAVFDVIAAILGESNNPRTTFQRLSKLYPEAVARCDTFKFPGQGQNFTPVTDARGFVMIVNILPGHRAAQFRSASADIVVRFLGGDMTLVEEIQRNATQAQFLHATSLGNIFAADVKSQIKYHPNRSTIYIKSGSLRKMNGPGVYFIIYGVKVVYDSDGLPVNVLVVGFGCSHNIAERFKAHEQMAGENTRLLNIIPTHNYFDLEKTMKTILKNSGRLVKGCVVGKPSQMGELFWVDSVEDYHNLLKDFEEEAMELDHTRDDRARADQEFEQTLKMMHANAETMNAEARLIEARVKAVDKGVRY
jgi:hypothetical protein